MKFIYLAILSLSLSAICFGQEKGNDGKPDFSGTWHLTEIKNVMHIENFQQFWTISQHDAEFKISIRSIRDDKETTFDTVYFTDGRGETNATGAGGANISTKTKWDGKTLKITEIKEMPAPGDSSRTIKLSFTRKLELSKDGSTLTETVAASGPPGMPVRNSLGGEPKRIFTRVK